MYLNVFIMYLNVLEGIYSLFEYIQMYSLVNLNVFIEYLNVFECIYSVFMVYFNVFIVYFNVFQCV
jgi:hypothetical protein